ncbi:amidohydrolase family protein [Longimicrobium sp.]|uniref:amidohydrolase family protein n=1 Tax=Longimicrobium sp. TaxID=2029185 RepID=UPI002E32170D|nr:amidohydrolase family protein [Longimicrobium sp.]HEX6042550.1 amidohydrolase family protein [Longimicrobium sp.]
MRINGIVLTGAALALAAGAAHAQVAVRGETVYTMAGAPIRDGVVLIGADGRIERVGSAAEVQVPAGYRTITGRVVTPGLVDAHSVVGLAGAMNQPHDQDQLDRNEVIAPELRAIDAYNAREMLVTWLRDYGITTVHTGHGPGALVSGQTMIVKTRGDDVGEALVDTTTMLAFTLGPSVSGNFRNAGTRARGIALLRAELLRAREYDRRRGGTGGGGPRAGGNGGGGNGPAIADGDRAAAAANPRTADRATNEPRAAGGGNANRGGGGASEGGGARDLGLEMLARLLNREIPALITAQEVPEILAALRLQEEFGFDMVLDGGAESYLVIDELRRANVPVILHPTMVRLGGETGHATLETARRLREAGITVALQSGYEGYVPKTRVVLFEAAIAAANGLPMEDALRTITIDAARIIGVGDRVGSLERGKDGDVAVFDGDPFEYTSHVCAVLIEGQVVSETCR